MASRPRKTPVLLQEQSIAPEGEDSSRASCRRPEGDGPRLRRAVCAGEGLAAALPPPSDQEKGGPGALSHLPEEQQKVARQGHLRTPTPHLAPHSQHGRNAHTCTHARAGAQRSPSAKTGWRGRVNPAACGAPRGGARESEGSLGAPARSPAVGQLCDLEQVTAELLRCKVSLGTAGDGRGNETATAQAGAQATAPALPEGGRRGSATAVPGGCLRPPRDRALEPREAG